MSDRSHRRGAARERPRKDKVLHARIPDQLDRELRHRAGRLGLSVSTVVRHALLHTFDLVEGILSDSAEIARALGEPSPRSDDASGRTESTPPEAPAGDSVLGWQEMTLNVNAVCERCNRVLPKGASAAVGVPVSARPEFLCRGCLGALSSSSSAPPVAAGEDEVSEVQGPRAVPSRRR